MKKIWLFLLTIFIFLFFIFSFWQYNDFSLKTYDNDFYTQHNYNSFIVQFNDLKATRIDNFETNIEWEDDDKKSVSVTVKIIDISNPSTVEKFTIKNLNTGEKIYDGEYPSSGYYEFRLANNELTNEIKLEYKISFNNGDPEIIEQYSNSNFIIDEIDDISNENTNFWKILGKILFWIFIMLVTIFVLMALVLAFVHLLRLWKKDRYAKVVFKSDGKFKNSSSKSNKNLDKKPKYKEPKQKAIKNSTNKNTNKKNDSEKMNNDKVQW